MTSVHATHSSCHFGTWGRMSIKESQAEVPAPKKSMTEWGGKVMIWAHLQMQLELDRADTGEQIWLEVFMQT